MNKDATIGLAIHDEPFRQSATFSSPVYCGTKAGIQLGVAFVTSCIAHCWMEHDGIAELLEIAEYKLLSSMETIIISDRRTGDMF